MGLPPAPCERRRWGGRVREDVGGFQTTLLLSICQFCPALSRFSLSPPIFPSSFTWGLLMHVIAKLAAVGGSRGVRTPPKNAPPVPSNPPPLHLHFYCHRSTAVLLPHHCNHYAIIPFPAQSVRDITNDLSSPLLSSPLLSSPLSCIVTGRLCSVSWKNSLISRADFKQVWQVCISSHHQLTPSPPAEPKRCD